ncbi:MAG: hypothetical protein K2X03_01615 [Bryobacteraceae bacterium]|nr:hypothetical protein [Bryobacteraceae bacterium]
MARQDPPTESAKVRPPFELFTVKGKLVNPDVDLDRISALIAADDEEKYPIWPVKSTLQ